MGRRKKKRKRNPVMDWIGYAALRVGLFILLRFTVKANLRFARFLGSQMWKHYERGRIRAMDNLRRSFPDKDEHCCEEIVKRSFQQIVMLVIDIFYTSKLVTRDNWRKYTRYKNIEQVK
jgi:lauroyl/myristoyl acyltransferase